MGGLTPHQFSKKASGSFLLLLGTGQLMCWTPRQPCASHSSLPDYAAKCRVQAAHKANWLRGAIHLSRDRRLAERSRAHGSL